MPKQDFDMDLMSKFGDPAVYYFRVTDQIEGAGWQFWGTVPSQYIQK